MAIRSTTSREQPWDRGPPARIPGSRAWRRGCEPAAAGALPRAGRGAPCGPDSPSSTPVHAEADRDSAALFPRVSEPFDRRCGPPFRRLSPLIRHSQRRLDADRRNGHQVLPPGNSRGTAGCEARIPARTFQSREARSWSANLATEPMAGLSSLHGYEGDRGMNTGGLLPEPIGGYFLVATTFAALAHRDRRRGGGRRPG